MTVEYKDYVIFRNLVGFECELSHPRDMRKVQKRIEALVHFLNKNDYGHKQRVITQMAEQTENFMKMQIWVPTATVKDVKNRSFERRQYLYKEKLVIRPSYYLKINDNEQSFNLAVKLFHERINEDVGLENFNHVEHPIIEISIIDDNGKVNGFELYLERMINEN